MVRNPDDRERVMTLDAAKIFELPKDAAKAYLLKSPYQDQRILSMQLEAGTPRAIALKPFEVLVFDAMPR